MIKCGIIGCGVIAPTHVEGYRALPDVEIVHLSDLIPERMEKLGEKYGIEFPQIHLYTLGHQGYYRSRLDSLEGKDCLESIRQAVSDKFGIELLPEVKYVF